MLLTARSLSVLHHLHFDVVVNMFLSLFVVVVVVVVRTGAGCCLSSELVTVVVVDSIAIVSGANGTKEHVGVLLSGLYRPLLPQPEVF